MSTELVHAGVRWLKFNLVGGVGIGVQIGVLVLLTKALHFGYLSATALAVEAAVLHNFVWHENFTWADNGFRRLSETLRRFWWFHATNGVVSIGGNLLLMQWLVGHLHIRPVFANLFSIAACSVANFLACDNWVFRGSKRIHSRTVLDPPTPPGTLSVPEGQCNFHNASGVVRAVRQFQAAAVGFANLARQYESDSAALRLGRVKRDENVTGIHEPRAVVFNGEH